MAYFCISPLSEKVGGRVPRVPHLIVPMGDSINSCQSQTPTVNGCDLTPPTQTQTSEQEFSDLTASNRRPPTSYSRNTPQSFSRWTRSYTVSTSTNVGRHLWHTTKISIKFSGKWRFGL